MSEVGHQYEGQLEEPDDDWFDDDEGSYCDACDEFGMYVSCVDDLCHAGNGCIHGDGYILCPHCKGEGKL